MQAKCRRTWAVLDYRNPARGDNDALVDSIIFQGMSVSHSLWQLCRHFKVSFKQFLTLSEMKDRLFAVQQKTKHPPKKPGKQLTHAELHVICDCTAITTWVTCLKANSGCLNLIAVIRHTLGLQYVIISPDISCLKNRVPSPG